MTEGICAVAGENTGTGTFIHGVGVFPHNESLIVRRLVHCVHVARESLIVEPPSADLSPTVEIIARGPDVPHPDRHQPGSRHHLPPYVGVEIKIRGEVLLEVHYKQLVAKLVYDEKEFLPNDETES